MRRSTTIELMLAKVVVLRCQTSFIVGHRAYKGGIAVVALATALVAAVGASSATVGATGARSAIVGGIQSHVVVHGDTVGSVSARYGVTPSVIIADNGLSSSGALWVGQTLRLDSRHILPKAAAADTIVINIPQRMLFHIEADAVTAIPVAVGRPTWATPIGNFTVVDKRVHPTWHVPTSIRQEAQRAGRALPAEVPPGPNNPLGQFWMGLSGGGIGIHGTNAPASIYRVVTHGCVRLHPTDIAWLFARVPQGRSVETVYDPMLLAEENSRVFLEVHPDVYRRVPNTVAAARNMARDAGLIDRVDWEVAETVVNERLGVVRDVTKATRPGTP